MAVVTRIHLDGPAPSMMTPAERRLDLFRRVDAAGDALAASEDDGNRLGRLADPAVQALRAAGLIALKVPLECGGFEAEPALQYEVFERVALANPAAAWCLFIHADVLGVACARFSDDALDVLFAHDPLPMLCGGGGLKPCSLTRVEGGYRLSGTCRYGSGMSEASWVTLSGVVRHDDGRLEPRICFLPKGDLQVDEAGWDMSGMRGTGSFDYRADEVFVPEMMTRSALLPPQRGGRMYRTGQMGYLGHSIPAVAWGIVGRALDRIVDDAGELSRGYQQPTRLGERQAFTRFLGEAAQKRRAARALMMADGEELMAAVDRGDPLPPLEAATRSAGAWVCRLAVEVMTDLVRHAGGSVLREGSPYERALRDVTVAASHIVVDESAHENLARAMLGHEGANLMA